MPFILLLHLLKQNSPPTRKLGFLKQLHQRLRRVASEAKENSKTCSCCRMCFKFMAFDFSSNNQIYQLLFTHSLFLSPSHAPPFSVLPDPR